MDYWASLGLDLVKAGLFPALVSALIAFAMQRNFFNQQSKKEEEKRKKDKEEKVLFMHKAFLQESKYNLSLIQQQPRGNNYKLLFDTTCYTLFKESTALLGEETSDKINKLYLELFESNSAFEGIYMHKPEVSTSLTDSHYKKPSQKIEAFISHIENLLNSKSNEKTKEKIA